MRNGLRYPSLFLTVLLMFASIVPSVAAQTDVVCGDIVEGEFTVETSSHEYYLSLWA
jgi:hypothetical protein